MGLSTRSSRMRAWAVTAATISRLASTIITLPATLTQRVHEADPKTSIPNSQWNFAPRSAAQLTMANGVPVPNRPTPSRQLSRSLPAIVDIASA